MSLETEIYLIYPMIGERRNKKFRDWLDRTCPKVWDNRKVKKTNFKPEGFGFDEECKRQEPRISHKYRLYTLDSALISQQFIPI
jgi:hypothetical protein